MHSKNMTMKRSLALLISASVLAGVSVADAAPRKAAKRIRVAPAATRMVGVQRATNETLLSKGRGQLVNLPAAISDVFVANEGVADVQVRSPYQLYVFGKNQGETSVYATNAKGAVVYSTNVRVAQNLNSIDQVLKASFPDSDISAFVEGQTAVLVGTVLSPEESQQAERIARGMLNPGVNVNDPNAQFDVSVVNRLKMATPLQVSLQVRIAEVSRTFGKEISANVLTFNSTTGSLTGGFSQGRNGFTTIAPKDLTNLPQLDASSLYGLPAGSLKLPFDPVTGQFIRQAPNIAKFTTPTDGKSTINLFGRLLGLDVAGALDAGETEGLVTTLASPTLTAISGQSASFIAGGEIPIPGTSTTALGTQSANVIFKPYGITLEFTPTVAADGRIMLKVRPEVSDLDYSNALEFAGGRVPGTTVRRVETTVELGSGQSLVIGGLMKAFNNNNFTKTPGAGDVPVLGALFRSNAFKRGETELMIVVTPYLVKPVSANQIVLPTDGYKTPTELGRVFNGEVYKGANEKRPVPTMAAPQTVVKPSVGASLSPKAQAGVAPAPGFSN